MNCLKCGIGLLRWQVKYCSNQCQVDYQYESYIRKWKNQHVDGNRGLVTRNISKHLKRYLFERFGEKCSVCKWNKKHPVSGVSPLEIDHIDGNAENNEESNLRILCPNCHSLTAHFKNYNKGRGRPWRKLKYLRTR